MLDSLSGMTASQIRLIKVVVPGPVRQAPEIRNTQQTNPGGECEDEEDEKKMHKLQKKNDMKTSKMNINSNGQNKAQGLDQ